VGQLNRGAALITQLEEREHSPSLTWPRVSAPRPLRRRAVQ
jgi:hypothetical protein